MRTVFKILAFMLPLLVVSACGDEPSTVPEFGFDPKELVFESSEDLEKSVTVSSNTYWQVSVQEGCDWLSLSLRGAGAGDTFLGVNVLVNTSTEVRSAKLFFETIDGPAAEFTVTQKGYVAPPPEPEPEPSQDLEGLGIGESYNW